MIGHPSNLDRERLRGGVLSGIVAGIAFVVAMGVDMAISRRPVNDFRLLADFGPLRRYWRVTGPIVHTTNSAMVGAVYAAVEPRLPGPGWLRGLLFTQIENLLLWPVVAAIDRVHPAIQEGSLPHFNRPWPFVAETLRHGAYGVTLGVLYERSRRRSRATSDSLGS